MDMTRACGGCTYCERDGDFVYCLMKPLFTEVSVDDEPCYYFTGKDGCE